MDLVSAVFLGVLQGLTEFLPVSSSGHLVLAQQLLPNFSQPSVLFDVVLHIGTLFAVLIYFRKRIVKLTSKYLLLIIVGTIPAALVGIFFGSSIKPLFENVRVVGFTLFLTGVFNLFVDKAKIKGKKMRNKDAFSTGLFQALAIVPGISRSGSTIFAGSQIGIARKKVAEFSFLLSVPAVAGATFLELFENGGLIKGDFIFFLAGFISAFIAGYLAIKVVFKLLLEKRFKVFAYYCFVVGALSFLI